MTAYVTSWERIGEEKGVKQGAARVFLIMIRQKFGAPPQWVHEKVEEADPETIERWADNVPTAESLELVFED